MMTADFVPYKEALELKALGFDEPCLAFFTWKNELKPIKQLEDVFNSLKNSKVNTTYCSSVAPTFSQAFRLFREKYGLFHSVVTSPIREERDRCWYVIHRVEKNEFDVFVRNDVHLSGFFDNYSQAELACLRKMIEIVKS